MSSWYEEMEPFEALLHIVNALYSLLYGVEDQQTLTECQQAADVWMRDLPHIVHSIAAGDS
jgi:hypothetical protein